MSERIIVEEALRRQRIFKELNTWLSKIVNVVKRVDKEAEVYLFGSVAEERHTVASDIDILIITRKSPQEVISRLWREGIGDPFQIHVHTRDKLEIYKARGKLRKLG